MSIAANVPENEVDGGASQSLELGIVFMLADSCQQAVEDVSRQGVVKDHRHSFNRDSCLSQLVSTAFQQRSYDRSRSGGTVCVPCLAYFGTIHGLADGETVKLHGPFCGDELQNVKRELLETFFKVQSCVIDLRERFVRLAAQALNTADEQPTLPAEFAVDRTLRTASELDDLVDGDALIAALQKQLCCDLLKLAVSNLSSRPLVGHSSLPSRNAAKKYSKGIHSLNPLVLTAFYAPHSSGHPGLPVPGICRRLQLNEMQCIIM